ncbi:MAG: tripartite tricarboxylate transporter TctB family protein [Pseudomonadota bacterium]
MNASRLQHTVAGACVLLVAVAVTWISFTQQPAEAFLFPRLISIFFCALAVWNFVRATTGLAKVGEGLDWQTVRNFVPGVIVMLIYVFFAAKLLGFYLASSLTFLIVYTLYDPTPMNESKGWLRRLSVTVAFMAVIYGLFALLLNVQTPRGIWI